MPDPQPSAPVVKTKMFWTKAIALLLSVVGAVQEVANDLSNVPLPGHWGAIVATAGVMATQIAHLVEEFQPASLMIFLLGAMALGSPAHATEGFGINPTFVGPAQFVETTSGWKVLPNAGLGVSLGWMDIENLNGQDYLNRALGVCFEENFGEAANAQTVNNAILGVSGNYKGISAVIGFQVMGDPLGGPGSSGLVAGASYSLDALIPNVVFF